MKYASDHFDGKIFLNPVPTEVMKKGAFFKVLKDYAKKNPGKNPEKPLGPFYTDLKVLNHLPSDTLRVTWLGHSTTLIEIDGKRFLTDPVWYQRVSPFSHMGPKRFFEVPIALSDLPPVDYIILSHDHYDHLDQGTMIYLTSKKIPVICPLGVGERLINWHIDKTLITELDWWQSKDLGNGFAVTAAPARHFSGRWINDRFKTLWASFAIKGPEHKVYYGADSGMFPGFNEIGENLGPFDLTLVEIGAYNENWSSIHMGPEAAATVHLQVKGNLLLPIHWGTFSLAPHPWKEPVGRLLKAADEYKVPLLLPAPGQTCTIKAGAYNSNWWQNYK